MFAFCKEGWANLFFVLEIVTTPQHESGYRDQVAYNQIWFILISQTTYFKCKISLFNQTAWCTVLFWERHNHHEIRCRSNRAIFRKLRIQLIRFCKLLFILLYFQLVIKHTRPSQFKLHYASPNLKGSFASSIEFKIGKPLVSWNPLISSPCLALATTLTATLAFWPARLTFWLARMAPPSATLASWWSRITSGAATGRF